MATRAVILDCHSMPRHARYEHDLVASSKDNKKISNELKESPKKLRY